MDGYRNNNRDERQFPEQAAPARLGEHLCSDRETCGGQYRQIPLIRIWLGSQHRPGVRLQKGKLRYSQIPLIRTWLGSAHWRALRICVMTWRPAHKAARATWPLLTLQPLRQR